MPQNGKLRALALAMLVTVWCGITFAATVANEAGDTSTDSLRDIVGNASPNNSIDFSSAVASIIPDGTATAAASNLTLTGRDNSFAVALDSLLSSYGIDAMTNTLTAAEGGIDLSGLDPTLASFGRPGVVIDGRLASRLLEFTAASPSETILTGLALQNVTQEYTQTDDDNSANSSANSDESADAGVLTNNPVMAGGALRIVGAGNLASLAFLNNTLSITGGIAKGGQSSGTYGYANATAPANAYGGAAYIGGAGEITSTLFRGNTVAAQGGTAVGGTATSTGNGYNSSARTESNATAHGGDAYISGAGEITLSIFQGNKAVSTGGTATGGNATATNGSADGYGNTNAYAYGGGAYIINGGEISSSFFLKNAITAIGGTATAGVAGSQAHATAVAYAHGGGVHIAHQGEITSSIFQGNTATATGGSATGAAGNAVWRAYGNASAFSSGAGAYILYGDIASSVFQGNIATATGGSVATGGTAASATWANADAYAFGGGASFWTGAESSIEDTSFIGNSVVATAGGIVTQGGVVSAPVAEARVSIPAPAMPRISPLPRPPAIPWLSPETRQTARRAAFTLAGRGQEDLF